MAFKIFWGGDQPELGNRAKLRPGCITLDLSTFHGPHRFTFTDQVRIRPN